MAKSLSTTRTVVGACALMLAFLAARITFSEQLYCESTLCEWGCNPGLTWRFTSNIDDRTCLNSADQDARYSCSPNKQGTIFCSGTVSVDIVDNCEGACEYGEDRMQTSANSPGETMSTHVEQRCECRSVSE